MDEAHHFPIESYWTERSIGSLERTYSHLKEFPLKHIRIYRLDRLTRVLMTGLTKDRRHPGGANPCSKKVVVMTLVTDKRVQLRVASLTK